MGYDADSQQPEYNWFQYFLREILISLPLTLDGTAKDQRFRAECFLIHIVREVARFASRKTTIFQIFPNKNQQKNTLLTTHRYKRNNIFVQMSSQQAWNFVDICKNTFEYTAVLSHIRLESKKFPTKCKQKTHCWQHIVTK